MENENIPELLRNLQTQIEAELELCRESFTPYVCAMIHTPGGRKKITDLICEYVGNHGYTIAESILLIEQENNGSN